MKRKVRSRSKLITEAIDDQFPDFEMVVDQAVDCRNYYVHGSVVKVDYNEHFDQVPFLTNTLEFVFAASDLVESGWDIYTWINEKSTLSHPFGQYKVTYLQQLKELKKLTGN